MIGGKHQHQHQHQREWGRNPAGATKSGGNASRPLRRGQPPRPSACGPSRVGWEVIHASGREPGCGASPRDLSSGGAAGDGWSTHGPSVRVAGTIGEQEARAFLRRHGNGQRPLSCRVAGGEAGSRTRRRGIAGSRQDGRSEVLSHAPKDSIGYRHRDLSGRGFGSAANLRRTRRAGHGAASCRRTARPPTLLSEATRRLILRHGGPECPRRMVRGVASRGVASRGQVSCVQVFHGQAFSVQAPRDPGVRRPGIRGLVVRSSVLRSLVLCGLVARGLSPSTLAFPGLALRRLTPRGLASGRLAAPGAAFRLLLPPSPARHDTAFCCRGLLTPFAERLARRWGGRCAPLIAVPVRDGLAEQLPVRGLLTARLTPRLRACLSARVSARAVAGGNPAAASGRFRAAMERAPSGAEATPEGVRVPWPTA